MSRRDIPTVEHAFSRFCALDEPRDVKILARLLQSEGYDVTPHLLTRWRNANGWDEKLEMQRGAFATIGAGGIAVREDARTVRSARLGDEFEHAMRRLIASAHRCADKADAALATVDVETPGQIVSMYGAASGMMQGALAMAEKLPAIREREATTINGEADKGTPARGPSTPAVLEDFRRARMQ